MVKAGAIITLSLIVVLGIAAFILFSNSTDKDTNNNLPNTNLPSNGKSVEISGFAFSPQTLSVKVGDTITWTNKDAAQHTVTSDSGSELSSSLLSQGSSYTHTFTSAGEYSYHCAPHPGMKAKIIVS